MNRIYYSAWNKLRVSLTLTNLKSTALSHPGSSLSLYCRSTPNNSYPSLIRFNSSSSSTASNNNENQNESSSNNSSNNTQHEELTTSNQGNQDSGPPPPPSRSDTRAASGQNDQDFEDEYYDDERKPQYPPPPVPSKSPGGGGGGNSIKDRLYRLSMQSPEEFVPTENAEINRRKKFENAPFPDQKARVSAPLSDPIHQYRGISYRGEEDDYSDRSSRYPPNNDRRGGYQGGGYGGGRGGYGGGGGYGGRDRQMNQYDNPRGYARDSYNNDGYSPRGGGGGGGRGGGYNSNPRRYNRHDDDAEVDEEDFFRPPSNKYNNNPRASRRGLSDYDEEEFDDEPRQSKQRNQLRKDYDLDDFDVGVESEPKQSSDIRFANSENRQAIKDAYLKRFPSFDGTTKREFHSCASGRASQPVPDLNILQDNVVNMSLKSFNTNNSSAKTYTGRTNSRASNNNDNTNFNKNDNVEDSFRTSNSRGKDKEFWKSIRAKSSSNNKPSNEGQALDYFSEQGDDPDVFGNVIRTMPNAPAASQLPIENLFEPEDNEVGNSSFRPEGRMTIQRLEREVVELIQQKKLEDAVLHYVTILKEGGFRYDLSDLQYLYRILISECAKVGYVKMAYSLFTDLRKRGINVKDSMYTSVLNAIANAPWDAEENLERLAKLRNYMERKGYIPNPFNYHAMIKAYGRNKDIETAFALVDEMMNCDRKLRPKAETFNFLLQACISDKDNGFRHALFTWDKMRGLDLQPDIYSYNLLLRATRECNVTVPPAIQKLVNKRMARATKSISDGVPLPTVVETQALLESKVLNFKESLELIDHARSQGPDYTIQKLPDMLVDAIICFNRPLYRLAVLGGVRGVLGNMKRDQVRPDLKTMTELVQIVDYSEVSDLFIILDKLKLKPDVHFMNALIKNVYLENSKLKVPEILSYFNQYRLSPDIYTWSALALGCHNWAAAKRLVEDMSNLFFSPNRQVYDSFMKKACDHVDPQYACRVLSEMKRKGIKPTPKCVEALEKLKSDVTKSIVQFEKGEEITALTKMKYILTSERKDQFLNDWRFFKLHYNEWTLNTEIELEPLDPWENSYREYRSKVKPRKQVEEQVPSDVAV